MNYDLTEVYKYLMYLKTYLEGDLDRFKKVCDEVETEEGSNSPNIMFPRITTSGPSQPNGFMQTLVQFGGPSGPPRPNSVYTDIPKHFRGTMPHTLSLFSAADIVGFLFRSPVLPKEANKTIAKQAKGTGENIRAFFTRGQVDPIEIEVLYDVFRCGMTHGYFAKLDVGVYAHSRSPQGELFYHVAPQVILNVNRLIEIVLNTLNNVINDHAHYPHMENRYMELFNDYASGVPQMNIANLKSLKRW